MGSGTSSTRISGTRRRPSPRRLPEAAARDVLDANLDEVRKAVREEVDPSAKGVAVFVSVPRGLRHVRALNFPVENHLVIDEAPFVLPLLERWHSEPSHLVVLLDSDRAQIFEAPRPGR